MKAVRDKSKAIGEFLEWLQQEKGVRFGKPHVHDERCQGWDTERGLYNPSDDENCAYWEGEFENFNYGSLEKLLAEYFGIDLNKIEKERRAILAFLRQ